MCGDKQPKIQTDSMSSLFLPPAVEDLQGGVSRFLVNVTGAGNVGSLTLGSNSQSATVTGLSPNTRYDVTVTIEVHGGERISSEPASVTTQDGGKYW